MDDYCSQSPAIFLQQAISACVMVMDNHASDALIWINIVLRQGSSWRSSEFSNHRFITFHEEITNGRNLQLRFR